MKNKIFRRAIVVVCCILGFVIAVFIGFDLFAKDVIGKVTIESIDTSNLEDGEYEGVATVGPVHVNLTVVMKEKKIDQILITEHINALGKKAETIVEEVILKQSIDVDSISGATTSSVCIKKAIENAIGGN